MKPTADRCRHGLIPAGCRQCCIIEDSGKRMSDRINLMVISHPWETIVHSWMAFRLADGDTDGILYDTRADAIAHQIDERWCCYFSMRAAQGGTKPLDCQLYINLHRQVYDAGGRLADPEAPSLIVSSRSYDILTGRRNP